MPPPPATLVEDLITEILLRLPPDDPASTVRASAVCKRWRRLLSAPAFCRRYREIHGGRPPMLGFLHASTSSPAVGFVPTSSFRPPWPAALPIRDLLDARHGRVLLIQASTDLVVWNPITEATWVVPRPVPPGGYYWHAAVLCAATDGSCDHLACHGGPFLVAFVCDGPGLTSACVYSSETGAWSGKSYIQNPHTLISVPGVLVGNSLLYYTCLSVPRKILQYDVLSGEFSMIDGPGPDVGCILGTAVAMEDGTLGFADHRYYYSASQEKNNCICVWSREVGADGSAVEWGRQPRVIDLEPLLPPSTVLSLSRPADRHYELRGCVVELGIFFMQDTPKAHGVLGRRRNDVEVFTIDVKSGKARRVFPKTLIHGFVFPYTSFYTLDQARRA